jgi:type VI secretion system secreted protein Hcp
VWPHLRTPRLVLDLRDHLATGDVGVIDTRHPGDDRGVVRAAPPAEEGPVATSIFARIGTIKGESRDARHKDEIEVSSWSWGVTSSGAVGHGAGSGSGRASLQDLTFTHHVDKASPLLMKACATGEHIRDAVIAVRRAGANQQDFLLVTMTDVVVTAVSTSVIAEGDAMVESVGLAFGSVDLEYKPQKPDGTSDAGVHFTYEP